MTVLLSFTVIQAQIVEAIPKTPEFVVLNVMLQGEAVSAMFVTVYSCIICAWCNAYEKAAERRFKTRFGKVRMCRLVDFAATALFFAFQFTFNIYLAFPLFDL